MAEFEEWQIALHGRRVIYRITGSGPPVVLIHGMLNSSRHWQEVAERLAYEHTVVAPDLIGHGDSAAPRGDYSLGAHAASIRDLLAAIGIERATIVGHSLGGGVAMQFFYQFPQRVERLALVSSGGLGRDVGPLLRTAALPGMSKLLAATIHPRLLGALWDGGARMRRRGMGGGTYLQAVARALRPLENRDAREAFLQTLRAVIDSRGQRVGATDRLYLLELLPTLIVWGERDHTIPIEHGRAAHRAIRGSRMRTLSGAAHFPNLEAPAALAEVLLEFIATTDPAPPEASADWGAVLAGRSPRSRRDAGSLA
ncbi:MAG TPA: alpha/beta fold hydrolase [Solirubrobacteraceae bacterium]|nr:alpha/beta fold hydrolase [Solirubrobacteraceae bacterium]